MKDIQLRPYQQESIKALMQDIETCNPVVAIPTGAGKTYIAAGFILEYLLKYPDHTILVISHTQDIVEQDYNAIKKFFPDTKIGLYSSGLKSKTIEKITVASIQSMYRKKDKNKLGNINLIIIDECHTIPPRKKSMYMQVLTSTKAKYIGMSATVYRRGQGLIYGKKDQLFDKLSYDLTSMDNFNSLVSDGYLTKLYVKSTFSDFDCSDLAIVGGDYQTSDMSDKFDRNDLTKKCLTEILHFGASYKSWLIFAIDINHADNICKMLKNAGIKSDVLHSKTANRRQEIKDKFIKCKIQALVSVGMITTGFDAPNCDMLVILRPTKSCVLHVQMIGRALRISPDTGKTHALVLDFAGNTKRLGPINDISIDEPTKKGKKGKAPVRICLVCCNICHVSQKKCDACGYQFPEKQKIKITAGTDEVVRQHKQEWIQINSIKYNIHVKKGKPNSFRVTYECGNMTKYKEYICMDHAGWANKLAKKWTNERWTYQQTPPRTVAELFGYQQYLRIPTHILVQYGGSYPKIINYIF